MSMQFIRKLPIPLETKEKYPITEKAEEAKFLAEHIRKHPQNSMQMRMHNLRRLSCPLTIYLSILESYALIFRVERDSLQLKGVWYRLLFENRKRFKSRLKTLR